MTTPIVSIIIPIYNVAKFLPRCIDSVLAQTFTDFELILVDDGSPDNSGAICDEYSKKDSRIRVFHNVNGGAAAARKFGVQQAKGDWIEFIDGDDTIPHDSVDRLYAIAKDGEYDIIVGTLNLNNKIIFKQKISGSTSKEDYLIALLMNETSIGPVAKLYRAKLFKSLEWKTPKEITNNEDLLMLISLTSNLKKVFVAQDIVAYNYLFRDDSASKSVRMPLEKWILLFDYIKHILYNESKKITIALYVYILRRLYKNNILYGVFIDPSSEILIELRNHFTGVCLQRDDLKAWRVCQDTRSQKSAYYKHTIKLRLRKLAKKILCR